MGTREPRPDLERAMYAARRVLAETATSDHDVAVLTELVKDMYDLDYTGIPEIVERAITSEYDVAPEHAAKVIRAMKKMYTES